MAPPKRKSDKEYNPATIGKFVTYRKTVIDSSGKTTTIKEYRPKPGEGYSILSDEVLNSGNTKLLKNFREQNKILLQDPNNAPSRLYIDSRIETAEKLDKMEQKAKEEAALGITPPKMEVDVKDGFIGLSKIKYPDYQTSANGCWSISYSMLLKSRGVDLSQEEIRRWRPDYPEGTKPEDMANPERKYLMNADVGNAIYPNGDLVSKILPNTAVNQLRLEPFESDLLSINGMPLNEAQRQTVEDEYCAQVKQKLSEQITDALVTHQSPVAISCDGHYVTITGISEDGKTLRYEESLGWEKGSPRTRTMPIDTIVNLGMKPHMHGGKMIRGGGLEIAWLSDIPQADYGSPEKPVVNEDHKDYVKMGADGSITVDVPTLAVGFSNAGRPQEGQVDGKAVEQMMEIDQTSLSKKLGAKVDGIGPTGGIMIGNKGTYYPKKSVQKGDPELLKNAYRNLKRDLSNVDSLITYTKNECGGEDEAKLRRFKESVELLKNAKQTDAVTLAAHKQTMQELCDFFLEKDDKGKTKFEQYCYNMNDTSRARYIESFRRLNQVMDLGKGNEVAELSQIHNQMEAKYAAEVEAGNIKSKQHMARVNYEKDIFESWEYALKNASGIAGVNEKTEPVKDKLAFVAASYILHKQMVEAGMDPPYPARDAIEAMVPTVKNMESFQKTVSSGMQPWLVIPKDKNAMNLARKDYRIGEFIDDLVANEKKLENEKQDAKRYEMSPKRMQLVQRRAGRIADRLDATQTGSYTGLGVISRRKNSNKFDLAKEAIRSFSSDENPTPEKTRNAAQTVLAYLDGKEKVRTRGFGRTRWNECMKFLANTMPRNQFEAYCDEVNRKRGVSVNSKDYIGPEDFYSENSTMESVMNDTKNRINRGQGTLRDYARLIAVRNYGDDGSWFEKGAACGSPEQKHQLRVMTDEILKNPSFASFITGASKESLQDMMEGDADDLVSAWDAHKELNAAAEKTKGSTGPLPQV